MGRAASGTKAPSSTAAPPISSMTIVVHAMKSGSPSLAVILGDPDAYRRLFSDRSGWRGARDARLTVAHAFSNELEEAEIHCDRLIGWINWNARQPRNDREFARPRTHPEDSDFAAVLFL